MKCLYYELWNPAIMMCTRILEYVLKTHILQDLKIKRDITSIGQCIEILKNENYNPDFLELLNQLRDLRNDAMHCTKRYKKPKAMEIFNQVMGITAWIYNMTVEK